ncbi:hypothetical protein [Nonomuraea sp. NPDC049684]
MRPRTSWISAGATRAPRATREILMVKTARRYAKYAVSALSTAIFVLNG